MKIFHLADIHVKNLKQQEEQKKVFQQFHDHCKEQLPDYIVVAGDIFHNKNRVSPEANKMVVDFLRKTADLAKTHVIVGNHDCVLRNKKRLDSLTPIIDALNHKNLFFHKKSKEVELDENFVLNILSIEDKENWVLEPTNKGKVNIALYHGSVSGVITDSGWIMNRGDIELSKFNNFDYALLGDIHRKDQILDKYGKIRYCGSLCQNNFGEQNDKGFLVWNIEDKFNFTCEHIHIENPKPFITIELTKQGKIPHRTNVPPDSKLRLIPTSNVSFDRIKKTIDIAKQRYRPESIMFYNNLATQSDSKEKLKFVQRDLRDLAIQEELIEEYLKEYELKEDTLKKVFELNRKYNSLLEQDEIYRNIDWKLLSLEWDNLFNYGEGNVLNFENLRGTVGIFGKNYSGKSSIVDSLLYTIFNSISKNERKNLNLINQNKGYARGKTKIDINGEIYKIERVSEKYEKKLRGKTTIEAKTDVDFEIFKPTTNEVESRTGEKRQYTDKEIRRIFGTLEDFLMTSMASQFGFLTFISEGSTKRKEILAKFLDLDMFEIKYQAANKDAIDLRGALKRLEQKDFDGEIRAAQKQFNEREIELERQQTLCSQIELKIDLWKKEIAEHISKIKSIPAKVVNIKKIKEELESKENELHLIEERQNEDRSIIREKREYLEEVKKFLKQIFNIEEYKQKRGLIKEKQQKIDRLFNEIKLFNSKLRTNEKKTDLLKEVPCGPEFSECKFIKDAYQAKKIIGEIKEKVSQVEKTQKTIKLEIEELDPQKVETHLVQYEQLLEKKQKTQTEISNLELKVQKNETAFIGLEIKIKELKKEITEYEENKDAIENKEQILKNKEKLEKELKATLEEASKCNQMIIKLNREHGSYEHTLKSLNDQKEELHLLREEHEAYDLFKKCMNSDGIMYTIIRERLPLINEEIAKILSNVVDFEIFFENDGRKLDIYIKYPKYDPRPIEMGSGAEKSIASMAIRLALLSVSSLPKSDIFILDEPGAELDDDNLDGFIRVLEMAKSYFKVVILISHLDGLKDIVDTQIVIDKKDGFAHVEQ